MCWTGGYFRKCGPLPAARGRSVHPHRRNFAGGAHQVVVDNCKQGPRREKTAFRTAGNLENGRISYL